MPGATLVRSTALYAVKGVQQPADLAFTVMAQFKLGRVTEARASLGRLKELMAEPARKDDGESRAFLREAEALVGGAAGGR